MIVDYCPNCERETIHKFVYDDPIFDGGLECLECHVVFEADPDKEEPNNNE